MYRNIEFYIGLLGSVFGILDVILYGYKLQIFEWNTFAAMDVVLVTQVVALLLSCLVRRIYHIIYGISMVAIGSVALWASVSGLLIPAALEIMCGVLAFRKMKVLRKEV